MSVCICIYILLSFYQICFDRNHLEKKKLITSIFFPIAFPIFLKISEKSQRPAYFYHLHIVYLNVFIMIGA